MTRKSNAPIRWRWDPLEADERHEYAGGKGVPAWKAE